MDKIDGLIAADVLEFAEGLFCLTIRQFWEVAEKFPDLGYFVNELIESNCGGEFQMGIDEVVAFLRFGEDDDEGYVRNYCLGWKTETEDEEGEES